MNLREKKIELLCSAHSQTFEGIWDGAHFIIVSNVSWGQMPVTYLLRF